MNYITSCPECSTQFLLTTAHLKSHRGKVQCGHCSHVFNAKNRITEIADDVTSAAEYQAKQEDADLQNTTLVADDAYSELVNTEEIKTSQNSTYIGEFSPATVDTSEIDIPIVIEDLTTDPKFSRKKFKINVWLFLLAISLFILAALQSIYFMRTKIAAEYPQFKPLIVQACTYLQCEVQLPKNLDVLLIDDSDMQEDENYESVINFSSSLINNANYAQAYPSIELTLTNAEDQPVLRRLIKPVEYLKPNTDLGVGIAGHEEIRIKLAIHPSDEPVAGYRVLLVY